MKMTMTTTRRRVMKATKVMTVIEAQMKVPTRVPMIALTRALMTALMTVQRIVPMTGLKMIRTIAKMIIVRKKKRRVPSPVLACQRRRQYTQRLPRCGHRSRRGLTFKIS